MEVALERGLPFHQTPNSEVWFPDPVSDEEEFWPEVVMGEICEWLEFNDVFDYVNALMAEGPAIFDRATY